MSNDEPVFADEPASKKGMSTTAKVVLVMLGVGGVALLLCCGGLFGAGIWLKRTVEQAQVTNPVQVRELAGQIASIQLPEQYEPQMGLQLPMLGMRMVTFLRSDQPGANVFLMENTMGMNPSDPAQRDQMLQQIQMQQGAQGGNLSNVEVREIEVAGQKVPFQFGTNNANGRVLRQAMGFVPLKKGVVLVVISAPVDSFDEDEVVAILQSIGEPGGAGDDSANAPTTGEPPGQQDPAATPAPAGTTTPETPPPVDEPVEAEQPEPATVPQ
jgi:hypothetical protein